MNRKDTTPLAPGSTIGVFGSGQLGRMLTHAAQRLGYHVHVYSPYADSPTGQVAERETVAPYEQLEAAAAFARQVDVVTLEFENVPAATIEAAAEHAPVRPSADVVAIVQHRWREKSFVRNAGLPGGDFAYVESSEDLHSALATIGCPAVLKTAQDGYDGKGQVQIHRAGEADDAWQSIGRRAAILEAFVDFSHELSVIASRGIDGSLTTFGPFANAHVNHILDVSVLPATELESVADEASSIARTVAEQLEVVGTACVEMFLTRDGRLLVNEIAPRPHNSGHLTIDACVTSQFEQHVRAICGLPLGSPALVRPAAMANLLGDLWTGGEPDWSRALELADVSLHLYGKREAPPGRKMGHLTATASTTRDAERLVRSARARLTRSPNDPAAV